MKQLAMNLPTWGGRRKGAGRKPKGRVALVSHEARQELDGRTPVHVVMRVRDEVRSLRARATFLAILAAFAAARERSGLRLTHLSRPRQPSAPHRRGRRSRGAYAPDPGPRDPPRPRHQPRPAPQRSRLRGPLLRAPAAN